MPRLTSCSHQQSVPSFDKSPAFIAWDPLWERGQVWVADLPNTQRPTPNTQRPALGPCPIALVVGAGAVNGRGLRSHCWRDDCLACLGDCTAEVGLPRLAFARINTNTVATCRLKYLTNYGSCVYICMYGI